MQAFVFNTRRPFFADARVREAFNYAFDFEWTNRNLFHSLYTRSMSFFSNSEMASGGLPTPEERALLDGLDLPEAVREREFRLPDTDGSGNNRENLRVAAGLLREAGWTVQGGRLMKDGREKMEEVLSCGFVAFQMARALINDTGFVEKLRQGTLSKSPCGQ